MTTRKELKQMYGDNVWVVQGWKPCAFLSLCGLKFGYNSGVYGWNWSAYDVNHTCILAGHRNTTGRRLPQEIADKYDEEACKILSSGKKWEQMQNDACALALEFSKELAGLK